MTEAVLQVDFAGPYISVQDGGRPGAMRYGLPASGAMDRRALAIANTALGRPEGAPALEVSLGGLSLRCVEGTISLAIAGGGFVVQAGERRLDSWQVLTLKAGDLLTVRRGPWGAWCYVALAGALDRPTWMGSSATHAASGLGGGMLRSGQTLHLCEAHAAPRHDRQLPCPVWARPRRELRVVMGPQERFFAPDTQEMFTHAIYRVTPASDRMGARLDGPRLPLESALGIPSEPILRGAVQVAGDGVPTLLMADHQTTGGYPKIATVIDPDTDAFAQSRPGDPVTFRPIPAVEAQRAARHEAQALHRYLAGRAQRSG